MIMNTLNFKVLQETVALLKNPKFILLVDDTFSGYTDIYYESNAWICRKRQTAKLSNDSAGWRFNTAIIPDEDARLHSHCLCWNLTFLTEEDFNGLDELLDSLVTKFKLEGVITLNSCTLEGESYMGNQFTNTWDRLVRGVNKDEDKQR